MSALPVRTSVPQAPPTLIIDDVRIVPCRRRTWSEHGTSPDGRLFRGARGGPLSESVCGHSVDVLLRVYATCIAGQEDAASACGGSGAAGRS